MTGLSRQRLRWRASWIMGVIAGEPHIRLLAESIRHSQKKQIEMMLGLTVCAQGVDCGRTTG